MLAALPLVLLLLATSPLPFAERGAVVAVVPRVVAALGGGLLKELACDTGPLPGAACAEGERVRLAAPPAVGEEETRGLLKHAAMQDTPLFASLLGTPVTPPPTKMAKHGAPRRRVLRRLAKELVREAPADGPHTSAAALAAEPRAALEKGFTSAEPPGVFVAAEAPKPNVPLAERKLLLLLALPNALRSSSVRLSAGAPATELETESGCPGRECAFAPEGSSEVAKLLGDIWCGGRELKELVAPWCDFSASAP